MLDLDTTEKSISSLCHFVGDEIVIPFFREAKPLLCILPNFILLTKTHSSNTFQTFWNEKVTELNQKQLKIDDVVELIWRPVFEKSCRYLESLKDRSVKLVTVDKLLDQYPEENNLELEIKVLEKGVSECLNQRSDHTWVMPRVKRMQEYRSLREHANAAKAFLNLKSTLNLTGDFIAVEELAAKVGNIIHIIST